MECEYTSERKRDRTAIQQGKTVSDSYIRNPKLGGWSRCSTEHKTVSLVQTSDSVANHFLNVDTLSKYIPINVYKYFQKDFKKHVG